MCISLKKGNYEERLLKENKNEWIRSMTASWGWDKLTETPEIKGKGKGNVKKGKLTEWKSKVKV